jgi:serine/threonine protein phosphatase PrpC
MTHSIPESAASIPSGIAPQRASVEPLLVARSFGLTDRGREREANEDQFLIAVLSRALCVQRSSIAEAPVQYAQARGQLFLVADGVGGAAAGGQASALAVGAIESFLLNTIQWLLSLAGPEGSADGEGAGVLGELQEALRNADARVCDAARLHPELRGMGTTLTMAFGYGRDLFLAHVGDSRCYLLRDEQMHQLTQDHTLVQEMVEGGVLPAASAAHHQLRHVITNVVGGGKPGVRTEVHKLGLQAEDVVLLCTDGLTEMLSDLDIATVLLAQPDPRAACEHLVALANERGGRDNVTVIVARYVPEG